MKVDPKQKEEARLERNIGEQCSKEEGLTFGYIGNFERWGDDRLLMIWVNEEKMRMTDTGNQRCLWRCPAAELVAGDAIAASHVIRGFQAGKEYNSHQSSQRESVLEALSESSREVEGYFCDGD